MFALILSAGIGLDVSSGGRTATYTIQLKEDYTLDIPVLGRIDAKGKTIPQLQRQISEGLMRTLALQHVSFTLAEPAQFNVFVYGNVERPGFVVITPMHRLIDAISISGGFRSNGSYRSIHLSREGKSATYDISRFYSHAELESNPYLKPGDTLFVPEADITASISGLVQFPGTYELVTGETLATLLNLAGGMRPGAQTERIEIHRIDPSGAVARLTVAAQNAREAAVKPGDKVVVRSISENVRRVTIEGAIFGSRLSGDAPVQIPDRSLRIDFPYYPGITLLDVLDEVGGPTPRAVLEESFLKRGDTGEIRTLMLESVWHHRDETGNVKLLPGDYVLIPLQRTEVFVSGAVNRPGATAYTPGYSVADYLLLSGGIDVNRGNPEKIYFITESGFKLPAQLTSTVEPGSHIFVDKKWLFSADEAVQNFFITTAWVTTIVAAVTTVLDFVLTYLIPAPQAASN